MLLSIYFFAIFFVFKVFLVFITVEDFNSHVRIFDDHAPKKKETLLTRFEGRKDDPHMVSPASSTPDGTLVGLFHI